MKKWALILFALSFALFGCDTPEDPGEKSRKRMKELEKQLDEMKKIDYSNLDLDLDLDLLTVGGQPGAISLRGAFVKGDEASFDPSLGVDVGLIPNISFSYTTGKGKDGKKAELERIPTFTKSLNPDDLENLSQLADGTYINIGCTLDTTEIQGLTKVEPKVEEVSQDELNTNLLVLEAEKIFFCGDISEKLMQERMASVKAKTLVLRNVDTVFQDNFAFLLVILADHIQLDGVNSFQSFASPSSMPTASMGAFFTFIANSITTDGQLKISAVGASYAE